jgi:hypothetical protein
MLSRNFSFIFILFIISFSAPSFAIEFVTANHIYSASHQDFIGSGWIKQTGDEYFNKTCNTTNYVTLTDLPPGNCNYNYFTITGNRVTASCSNDVIQNDYGIFCNETYSGGSDPVVVIPDTCSLQNAFTPTTITLNGYTDIPLDPLGSGNYYQNGCYYSVTSTSEATDLDYLTDCYNFELTSTDEIADYNDPDLSLYQCEVDPDPNDCLDSTLQFDTISSPADIITDGTCDYELDEIIEENDHNGCQRFIYSGIEGQSNSNVNYNSYDSCDMNYEPVLQCTFPQVPDELGTSCLDPLPNPYAGSYINQDINLGANQTALFNVLSCQSRPFIDNTNLSIINSRGEPSSCSFDQNKKYNISELKYLIDTNYPITSPIVAYILNDNLSNHIITLTGHGYSILNSINSTNTNTYTMVSNEYYLVNNTYSSQSPVDNYVYASYESSTQYLYMPSGYQPSNRSNSNTAFVRLGLQGAGFASSTNNPDNGGGGGSGSGSIDVSEVVTELGTLNESSLESSESLLSIDQTLTSLEELLTDQLGDDSGLFTTSPAVPNGPRSENTVSIESAPTFQESFNYLFNGFKTSPSIGPFLTIPAVSFGGTCPTYNFDIAVFSRSYVMDSHCTILNSVAGQLSVIFYAVWSILAVIIFLKA